MGTKRSFENTDGARTKRLKSHDGHFVDRPRVGASFVLIRPGGSRVITSAVVRVLGDVDSDELFIETENSIYRIARRSLR